jgi:hypothetical protein
LWSLAIEYFGHFISLSLLLRAIRTRMWLRYPFFYFSLTFSLLAAICLTIIGTRNIVVYACWYWNLQFISMFVACGNIVEVLRLGFVRVSEAVSFARVIGGALLLTVLSFAVFYAALGPKGPHGQYHVLFERNFRLIQALFLLLLSVGIFYFAIPLGRNLRGIFLGYGVYIGSSLISLALESHFPRSFVLAWMLIQPLSYVLSLVIYLFSLWSFEPPVIPEFVPERPWVRSTGYGEGLSDPG